MTTRTRKTAMSKAVRGVSGKVVTSKNAIRRAEQGSAKSHPGRPKAYLTHPQLLDKGFLEGKYQTLTLAQIGEMIGVSKETVRKAMVGFGIELKEPGTYKTGEDKPRKRSPRSRPVLTSEQRQLELDCPKCGERQWYTPLKSDTWLCNTCDVWFDVTCVNGVLVTEEAHTPE